MADIFPLRASEHETVQQLLPWYVNGTLSTGETERVKAHLAECAECREELEFDRKLARGVATLPLNVDDSWRAMEHRLADPRPDNVVKGRFGFLNRSVPMRWAATGSMAAALAAVVVVSSLQSGVAPQQTYRTLGSAAATGGQVVVLFRPDTTEQQMRVILAAQGARLVDGPTAAGAYVLRVDNGNPETAIKALRQSSQVVLAEPVSNDGRP